MSARPSSQNTTSVAVAACRASEVPAVASKRTSRTRRRRRRSLDHGPCLVLVAYSFIFCSRVSRPTETTVLPHCSLLRYRYRYKLQYTCSCVSMSKSNLCTRYVLLANQPANRFFVFQRFCSLVPTMTATR